jgi:hypothetical protein
MRSDRVVLSAFLTGALMFVPSACKRKKVQTQATIEEGAPSLAATVHLNDPKVAEQLLTGFYDIEANAWRWTARTFIVLLRPPAGAAQIGATLQVHLTVPAVVIDKLKSVALTASIGDTSLAPETYSKPGDYVYERDVPAAALKAPAVRVQFQLDKAIPPSQQDLRELGIVVSSVGLSLK